MKAGPTPTRGRAYWVNYGDLGRKPFLVVSTNVRNTRLEDVIAVRITTSRKPDMTTVVLLSPADPLVGSVLCDDVEKLYRDELLEDLGAVSHATMSKVEDGLRAAIGL